jgi:hypothetical protein
VELAEEVMQILVVIMQALGYQIQVEVEAEPVE